MAKKHERKIKIVTGSGNVFADLGFEDADDELAKAKLAAHIGRSCPIAI